MAEICNENLHKAQRRLRKIRTSLMKMQDECCNTGQTEARDILAQGGGYLMIAEGILGGLCMKGIKDDGGEPVIDEGVVVQPLSGGK